MRDASLCRNFIISEIRPCAQNETGKAKSQDYPDEHLLQSEAELAALGISTDSLDILVQSVPVLECAIYEDLPAFGFNSYLARETVTDSGKSRRMGDSH